MSEVRNFMGYLWVTIEDGVATIGVNEDGLEDFAEVTSLDLPSENEKVEAEVVIGTLETDEGPLDIYSPVSGKVIEINQNVLDEPGLIIEDPYEEGWLVKIETSDDLDEDEEEDEDDEDEDDLEEEEEN